MSNTIEFEIVTSKKVADCIENQFKHDEKFSNIRSIILSNIEHNIGFSTVKIKVREGYTFQLSDVFFVGFFTGINYKSNQ